MKRLALILSALILSLSLLASCGGKESGKELDNDPTGTSTGTETEAGRPVTKKEALAFIYEGIPVIHEPFRAEKPVLTHGNPIDLEGAKAYVRENEAKILAEKYDDNDVSIDSQTTFFALDIESTPTVDDRGAIFPILWKGKMVDTVMVRYDSTKGEYFHRHSANGGGIWRKIVEILTAHPDENYLVCTVDPTLYILISEKNEIACYDFNMQDVPSFFSLSDTYYDIYDNDLTRISAASLGLK